MLDTYWIYADDSDKLDRIEDRRTVANIEPILAKAKAILDSSETIARKQRELDRKPGW